MSRSLGVVVFVAFYFSSNFYCLLQGRVLTEDLYTNYARLSRQAGCQKNQFRCKSGQCIADINECDGNVDCTDGSDESTNCSVVVCPPYLFRCEYGACIRQDLTCNGKQDCRDNSDETIPECNNIISQESCGQYMYKCPSGKCVPESNICDGVVQCDRPGDQNADESEKECKNFFCPPYLFKCRYGACVNGKAECNGIRECIDGSDEDENKCGSTSISFISTSTTEIVPKVQDICILPAHPDHGRYTILSNSGVRYIPGDIINLYTSIQLRCNPKYIPDRDRNVSICMASGLQPLRCLRTCPNINNSESRTATCKLNDGPRKSCINAVEGTIATLKCGALYEDPGSTGQSPRVCRDGSWDPPISTCSFACGRKTPKATPTIVDGAPAFKGDYPWQVAVYKKGQYICGGSLLNQRVIISAAHCFSDMQTGNQLPVENFDVAVGKYYIGLDDPRDDYAQHDRIDSIFFPEMYRGNDNLLQHDLAIVVIKGMFDFAFNVLPVCVDWQNEFESEQLIENQFGVVTGWGLTKEDGNPAEELREVHLPYVSYGTCYNHTSTNFRVYLTLDKLCAGFLNKGISVCKGDSGGGLVFKDKSDRYYIRGIVSSSPMSEEGSCNSNQYSTYTRISSHLDFITQYEARFRPRNLGTKL